ncbi:HAMP domain-containing histidine kinase [Paenalcaligenes niemegkensis]|uniref:sensor histidine kinase n=1 Tax=Paenalcaligenes niemegkensis TaxID=2895469 RepID=UPI001EE78475|nr:HAMP domain-containing sensor histidine kinase [Paenalcaligenes niemegkensis]MCQ9616027.1 HAMP domain-containing histidine kinase [Paenalcaligenes niemegkensis]
MKSIANRIYKTILAISIASMLVMVTTVMLINDDLEDKMLGGVTHPDVLAEVMLSDEFFMWEGGLNTIVFMPAEQPLPENFPTMFKNLGELKKAELEIGGSTYLINIEHSEAGTLYWARDISAFEIRENKLSLTMLPIILAITLFSVILAFFSNRTLVRPLRKLSEQIGALPIAKNLPPIEHDYKDQELYDIAITVNRFLGELESYIQREQQLLSLASHELRTPIAVVSGALDVIESRDQLSRNDQLTLGRIRRANNEMGDNVNVLLRLARHDTALESPSQVNVGGCVEEILDDMATRYAIEERVNLNVAGTVCIQSYPVPVKMLLRNLIQNALQHTSGEIDISVNTQGIIIRDHGTHYSENVEQKLKNAPTLPTSSGGLGLYIVTLMCEQLKWSLHVSSADSQGTLITVDYP